jgi:hypothetical protein
MPRAVMMVLAGQPAQRGNKVERKDCSILSVWLMLMLVYTETVSQ